MKDAVPSNIEDTGLGREEFMTTLVANLVETTESYLGYEEAASFVSEVGDRMGATLSAFYQARRQTDQPNHTYIAAACTNLKTRIDGQFTAVDVSEDRIVFENTQCPFHDHVIGSPALCMMTTNVFGRISADANGYARVHIEEAIATGHNRCRVCVTLKPEIQGKGHEFFR